MLDYSSELAFQAQLLLVYGISQEISELLGSRQSQLFESEILASIPTMKTVAELQQVVSSVASQTPRSLKNCLLSDAQMRMLHQSIQKLSTQYLGKEYAAETISNLFKQLPINLKQHLIKWFESLK